MEEHHPPVGRVRPEQRRANRFGKPESDRAADQRAEQVGDFGVAQAGLDDDHQQAERDADREVQPSRSG